MDSINVTLTAYNMDTVYEADFDKWASYVSAHINERCGFEVVVYQGPFSGSGVLFEDRLSGGTEEQRGTVRDALRAMWDEAAW